MYPESQADTLNPTTPVTHDCDVETVETSTSPLPSGEITITGRCQVCGRVTSVTPTSIL